MKKLWIMLIVFVSICIGLWAIGESSEAADVTLEWDANCEPDLAGYKIYYDVDSGVPYNGVGSTKGNAPIIVPLSALPDPSNPMFQVTGLPNSCIYFVVTAYDTESLESDYSNEVNTNEYYVGKPPTPINGAKVTNITNYGTVIINQ